jgi:transcriptional regulator with XRE-family HTH domain
VKSLKELRELKKKTQQEMADILEISKSHYCNIENGKRTLSYERACKIASFLKVPITEINFFAHQVHKLKTA